MIAEFKQGPKQLLARINELIRLVRTVSNLRGDQYIRISREGGTAIGLNIEQVMARMPKLTGSTSDAGPGVRLAYCITDATDSTIITCHLDTEAGETINVNCAICGGTALNSAIPRLEVDDLIFVSQIGGTWYCLTVFQASQDCV